MSFDSDYLDLAIGLAVVFFLASLVVSGLNEAFAWLFRRRAKFLWAWLYNLVSSTDVNALTWRPTDRRPSDPDRGDVSSRLLRALASVSPTGKRDKKTTIKHIPPSSLAQAFLEVFSDLGRETLAAHLPKLLSTKANERGSAAAAVGSFLAHPPGRPAATVQQAFQSFADARTSTDEAIKTGAAEKLAAALAGLSGATGGGTGLSAALTAFADATDGTRQQAAESVISALARLFPDVLVRERLQASMQALDGTPLAPTMKRLWDTATGEMDKFREQFEGWLQGELDRLGGFYKRSIRWITLIFVVLVTVVLNIDAIGLTQNLWRHPEGRTALVGFAQQTGVEGAGSPGATTATATAAATPADSGLAAVRAACEAKNATSTTVPDDPEAAAKSFTDVSNCVTDAVNALSGLDVIGAALIVDAHQWGESWTTGGWAWWRHLLGLLATGAALFLGAPFWFDIVKRLTGVRKQLVGDT